MLESFTNLYLLCYITSSFTEENMVIRAHNRKEALEIARDYDKSAGNHIRSRAWDKGPVTCQELTDSGGCWVITAEDSMDDLRVKLDNNAIDPL